MWCAARATEAQILPPDGMVKPEIRTPKHLQEILECWLEHGELSIVARRVKARYQKTNTGGLIERRRTPRVDGHYELIGCEHHIAKARKAGKSGGKDGAGIPNARRAAQHQAYDEGECQALGKQRSRRQETQKD
jgi:hypothetical protein